MATLSVNDGCPPKGATDMLCREGYKPNSPLCAICSEGYYKQLRRCVKCEEPKIGLLVAAVLGVAVAVAAGAFLLYRLRKYLTRSLLALFKILVAFLTIVMTIDTQFGVQWPAGPCESNLKQCPTLATDTCVGVQCLAGPYETESPVGSREGCN